jgi:hypothetical protein
MTDLERPVTRRSVGCYDHRGRRMVITLAPGDVILVREERTRKSFSAPLVRVMRQIIIWNADAARAEKSKNKKVKVKRK